ncbi:MAG: hypothetical protein JWO95_2327 [Verrucomicrobiales bacterium]|nr:hypothetical protein [Verrucomicrobiales bacterium]
MYRGVLIVLVVFATFCARAQDALNAFTNRADQVLRSKWGFGVNEIPIYCSTNPLVRYNGGIHWLLQQAVNAYDQTNHTVGDFDFPSVFRPQFAVVTNDQCVAALITNWVEAADDYLNITARPFKASGDPTLSSDDNVWGIGMVIGVKPAVPIFNEFGYLNNFNVSRKLLFRRNQPGTRPFATNQMYVLSLSNIFGCSALNTSTQALPRDVTMYFTNSANIRLVNELGLGTTSSFTNGATQIIVCNQWPKNTYVGTNMYKVLTNTVFTLPTSGYVEGKGVFGPADNAHFELNAGLPVHSWFVEVTNRVVYALIDNVSGRMLDFVNYDQFGTSVEMMQRLQTLQLSYLSPWQTNGANSSLFSPASIGVLNQISVVTNSTRTADYIPQPGASSYLTAFLNGTDNTSATLMECPYQPSATVQQTTKWWVATAFPVGLEVMSPGDRCTIDEMASATSFLAHIPIGNIASLNLTQNSGNWQGIQITQITSDSNNLSLQFNSYTDGQYGIWSSPNLLNWGFVGVAAKLTNNVYGFSGVANGAAATLYFQARKF